MSFDNLKRAAFRQEAVLVELLLDQNDIGIDFSSDPNSYNTPKTTSDPTAFNPDNPKKSYFFADQHLDGFDGAYFPNLVSASQTTPELKIGENIGSRASASIRIEDFITNDAYELPAPYDDRRVTGSFWGKLIARNFIRNREIVVYRGYIDPQDGFQITNFQGERYVIQDFSRDKDGGVTIKAIDPLFFTNEAKAKMPVKSTGELDIDLFSGVTTMTVFTENPTEYGAVGDTGVVRINDELIEYEVTAISSNTVTMTIVRGALGTIQQDHTQGDLVQKCYVADNRNVVDIIRDSFSFTNIDTSYIPDSDWENEKLGALSIYNFTTILTKPTEVKKVLSEMIRHCGGLLYWDTVASSIVLKGNPEFQNPDLIVDENVYEQDSIKISDLTRSQVTRAAINFAKRNYVLDDKENNYRRGYSLIDDLAESPAQFSDVAEAKTINSNWLTSSSEDTQTAVEIINREVSRKSRIPFETTFIIDSEYIGLINGNLESRRVWLGSLVEITNHLLIAANGERSTYRGQITKLQPRGFDKWEVTVLSISSAPVVDFDYTITGNLEDILLTDIAPPIDGRVTNILIQNGAVIGATSTENAALDTGNYPDGLNLVNRGRILGEGGKGGDSGILEPIEPSICSPSFRTTGTGAGKGGPALIINTSDVTLDNGGSGLIYGGGGGGADRVGYQGDSSFPDSGPSFPQPGAGGQGYQGGQGGLANQNGGQAGENGSQAGPGRNPAADGGEWGTKGQDQTIFLCGQPNRPVTTVGGAAGESIITNGNQVFISDGNNGVQIRGPIV